MEVEITEEYESSQRSIFKGTDKTQAPRFDPVFTQQYRASQRDLQTRTKRKCDEQMQMTRDKQTRDEERVSAAEVASAASAKLRMKAAVAVAAGATLRNAAKVREVKIVLEAQRSTT